MKNENLIISWGSTYGAVKESLKLIATNDTTKSITHLHLRWIYPLHHEIIREISTYSQITVVELNDGQLANYLTSYIPKNINKICQTKGIPFATSDLSSSIVSF